MAFAPINVPPVTLHRGDELSKRRRLRKHGLLVEDRWGSRHPLWGMHPEFAALPARLRTRPAALALDEIVAGVRAHVRDLAQGAKLPFYSFSTNRNVAMGYALGGGRRRRGLLLTMRVRFVGEHSARLGAGPASVLVDAGGRLWLDLARFIPATRLVEVEPDIGEDEEEATPRERDRAEAGADFHGGEPALIGHRAARDAEYLLLNDAPPGAFEMRAVCR